MHYYTTRKMTKFLIVFVLFCFVLVKCGPSKRDFGLGSLKQFDHVSQCLPH